MMYKLLESLLVTLAVLGVVTGVLGAILVLFEEIGPLTIILVVLFASVWAGVYIYLYT